MVHEVEKIFRNTVLALFAQDVISRGDRNFGCVITIITRIITVVGTASVDLIIPVGPRNAAPLKEPATGTRGTLQA